MWIGLRVIFAHVCCVICYWRAVWICFESRITIINKLCSKNLVAMVFDVARNYFQLLVTYNSTVIIKVHTI